MTTGYDTSSVFGRVGDLYSPENDFSDPLRWMAKKAKETLWSTQAQIAQSVRDNRYTAVPSAHGMGKSFIASRIIAWWIDSHPPGEAFVVSTAPSAAQVSAIMWRETAKIHRKADLVGRILSAGYPQWKIGSELVGYGRKPADYEESAFQGIHARYVLIVIDEACHDDQTDVMTDQGWKRFAELDGTERLLTMNPKTHEAHYTYPERIVKKRYQGPMLKYEAKGGNFCVTPDHEMLYQNARVDVWRKAQAAEVFGNKSDRFMKKVIDWHDVASDGERAELLGWYFSEGSIGYGNGKPNHVTIAQINAENMDRIEKTVAALGLPYSRYPKQLRIRSSALAREFEAWGRGALHKAIPDEIMQAGTTAINRFLDAFELGDGYRKGKGGILYTSNQRMADQLQELVLKTGVPAVLRMREMPPSTMRDGRVIPGGTGYVVTRPHQRSQMKVRGGAVKTIEYDGYVYCASVPPSALLFTRRKGYSMWSGNCGVAEHLFNSVDSLATNEHARVLAIGNPDDPASHFAKICEPGSLWNVIQIDALRSPGMTEAAVVGPDPQHPRYPLTAQLMRAEKIPFSTEQLPSVMYEYLTGPLWVEERIQNWAGVSRHEIEAISDEQLIRRCAASSIFMAKARGVFPTTSNTGVIPLGWVQQAVNRWQDWVDAGSPETPGRRVVGVDVARGLGENDESCLAIRQGDVVRSIERFRNDDTTETASMAARYLNHPQSMAVVDVIGIGAGVYDLLRKWSLKGIIQSENIPFNASAQSHRKDRLGSFVFRNDRAAAWWNFRELLDPSRGSQIALPPDERLMQELTAPGYDHYVGGRLKVEEKDEIRKRIGRSTDSADAVIQSFWVQGMAYDHHNGNQGFPYRHASRGDGIQGYGNTPLGQWDLDATPGVDRFASAPAGNYAAPGLGQLPGDDWGTQSEWEV